MSATISSQEPRPFEYAIEPLLERGLGGRHRQAMFVGREHAETPEHVFERDRIRFEEDRVGELGEFDRECARAVEISAIDRFA
jgi:hypothetical protein